MLAALAAYQRGFAGRKAKICYAMKANSSLGVLQVFVQAGCGFDIVSGGELERVLAAGALGHEIIFSGVGETRGEMQRALEAGIGCFNVESEAELEVLSAVARGAGAAAPVSLPVNPNVDPKTHPYISTGLKGNKFGMAHSARSHAYRRAASLPGLKVVGIDCHIGSQITDDAPYLDAMDRSWTWWRRSRQPASRCSTSTSAAAWASTTTATSRRPPMRCGPSSSPSWTRAASATGSS